MKLSISNIAWNPLYSGKVYEYISEKGFTGLEIAPTAIFHEDPYDKIDDAVSYAETLKKNYGLEICSMQSIWYGQSGNIFDSDDYRKILKEYTKKAIDFASAIGCENLVFGNPKARNRGNDCSDEEVSEFFCDIADYAVEKSTCISLEPNPPIYNTNFINSTSQAFEYCRQIKSKSLKVNVDLGTVIYNKESLKTISENIELVNHIHISEPYLAKIEKRDLHKELASLEYDKYFSIEMGKTNDINDVFEVVDYIAGIFI